MGKGRWYFFPGVLVLGFFLLFSGGNAPAQERFVTYLSLADYTGAIAGLNVPADMGV